MDEITELLEKNRIEDVSWLCSLSESELDLLITLKMLVLQRAKIIGHEELVKKFDLKTLRGIGFVLMEQVKGKLTSNIPDLAHSTSVLDGCNLLNCSLEKVMSYEELKTSIGSDNRKKPGKRSRAKKMIDEEDIK